MIFIHIPKTAGTSFIAQMGNLYGEINSYRLNNINKEDFQEIIFPKVTAGDPFFFAGHNRYAVTKEFSGKCNHFTFLRNPVARVGSLLRFYKSQPHSSIAHLGLERDFSFADFINSRNPELFYQVNNGMCRQLSEHFDHAMWAERGICLDDCEQDYLSARRFLENNLFGIVERMHESELQLMSLFSLPFDLDTYNENVTNHEIIEVDERMRREILLRNQFDLRLYDYAVSLFDRRISFCHLPVSGHVESFKPIKVPCRTQRTFKIDEIAWRQGFHQVEPDGFAWLRHDVPARIYICSSGLLGSIKISMKFYSVSGGYPLEWVDIAFNGISQDKRVTRSATNDRWFEINIEVHASEVVEVNSLVIYQLRTYRLAELGLDSSDFRRLGIALSSLSIYER
jgi:hypothetical protein